MEQGCSTSYSKLIDKLLIEDLSPNKMSELRGHMASCPACQHRYNRVVLASRLLDGGPKALELPSERELGWVEEAVLERARLVPDAKPARRSMLKWVVGFAAAAAAVVIAIPLTMKSAPPAPPTQPAAPMAGELQARGAPPRVSPQVGVRALCVQQAKDKTQPVVFEAKADNPSQPMSSCRVNDILRFTYTNRSKMDYLFLVGVDRQYGIKWYEPRPPKKISIKVQKKVVDETLSRAVKLRVNHNQGTLRLFAIFSAKPLHADQIKQAVSAAHKEHTPLERLELLQVENTEQRSMLVNLSGEDKK